MSNLRSNKAANGHNNLPCSIGIFNSTKTIALEFISPFLDILKCKLLRVETMGKSKERDPIIPPGLSQMVQCWVGFIFIVPLLILFFGPLKIWKIFATYIARKRRKDLHALLTGYDSIFAVDNMRHPYAVNITVMVVKGHVPVNSFRAQFNERVFHKRNESTGKLQYDKLRCVPERFLGYFFWKEVNIDLRHQIKQVHLFDHEDVEDFKNHERMLHEFLGEMMTAGLPEYGSPWEILVVNGFQGDQTLLVFRLHHALGDGYSFNHMIDELMCVRSAYMVRGDAVGTSGGQRSVKKQVDLWTTGPAYLESLYSEAFRHKDYFTQRKINTTGVMSSTVLDLEVMKNIRRKTGTHFATVGMSILAGACQRFFEKGPRGQGRSGPYGQRQLPPWVSIMHSLPKVGHPLAHGMCNHWGVGLFKIPLRMDPTGAIADSVSRLLRAEKAFLFYVNAQIDHLLHLNMPLFCCLPTTLIRLFFSTNFGTGIGFTSVPAYSKEGFLFGDGRHPVKHMFKVFGLQWKETAVAAAVYTYNGKVGYSVYANKDLVPDQASIDYLVKTCLHEEVDELMRKLGVQPSPTTLSTGQFYQRTTESFA